LKNPGDLTGEQRTTLAVIAKTNNRLYRAYLFKEQLRAVFAARGRVGRAPLADWVAWVARVRTRRWVLVDSLRALGSPLITMAMLTRIDLCPQFPVRSTKDR
jgi:transposase